MVDSTGGSISSIPVQISHPQPGTDENGGVPAPTGVTAQVLRSSFPGSVLLGLPCPAQGLHIGISDEAPSLDFLYRHMDLFNVGKRGEKTGVSS